MRVTSTIVEGLARSLWVLAYADYAAAHRGDASIERPLPGEDWEEVAPETPAAAEAAARELANLYTIANGVSLDEIYRRAASAAGVRWQLAVEPWRLEQFGRALAHMAVGSGVSWFDDHPTFELVKVHFECAFDGDYLTWSGSQEAVYPNPPRSSTRMWIVTWTEGGREHEQMMPERELDGFTRAMRQQQVAFKVAPHLERRATPHIARGSRNPPGLTAKGERMYAHVKAGYGTAPRAKEIASRTVYARAHAGTPGLVKSNPLGQLALAGMRLANPTRHGAAYAHSQDDLVHAYLLRMTAGDEVDARGIARATKMTPIEAEQALDRLVATGDAVKHGAWYAASSRKPR